MQGHTNTRVGLLTVICRSESFSRSLKSQTETIGNRSTKHRISTERIGNGSERESNPHLEVLTK